LKRTLANIFNQKKAPVLLFVGLSAAVICLSVFSSVDRCDLIYPSSPVFCDRYGRYLRIIPDTNGERHLEIAQGKIPEAVKQAFIAAEDERFYNHMGFDPAAIFRALKDNVKSGKIVSGASTITQQLCRLVYPHRRSYWNKFIEIIQSMRLECMLSKDAILEHYLNRVPLGNNIRGVELAAQVYFGKSAADLDAAEAAVLAALPKAPGKLNPYGRHKAKLFNRQNWVLTRMADLGFLSKESLKETLSIPIHFKRLKFPFKAPHFVDLLAKRAEGENLSGRIVTTVDLDIQQAVSKILAAHEIRLRYRGANQAAAMVVDNSTMEVLASAGSISYEPKNGGFNNGTLALRSPGSTLKPFAYALALESGLTVTSLLEDTLRKFYSPRGDYIPANYDRQEYGPVTMRTALGNSLNISAIKILKAIGLERFYSLLEQVDLINYPSRDAQHYGLGLVLGNPEASLEQLTGAYAMFANGGVHRALNYFVDSEKITATGKRIFSPETAFIIADILSDPSARLITFGNSSAFDFAYRVALKTGTSTRYRDGWTLGFTPEYTVGVWVGNFDGRSTYGLSGAAGAGPIFKDIIDFLYLKKSPSAFRKPAGVNRATVCGFSGMKPGKFCRYVTRDWFIRGTQPDKFCTFHDNQQYYHKLPANYAAWVYQKEKRNHVGAYRLKGFSTNLDHVFRHPQQVYDHSNEPGVRIKNRSKVRSGQKSKMSAGLKEAANKERPKKRHITIGSRTKPSADLDNYSVNIIYPMAGDRFVFDQNPEMGIQAVKLEAVCSGPVEYIDWFIDGQHFARTGPPYSSFWNPSRGSHRISVVTPAKIGDSVEILVE
jgi:penicillin-binding protein 1C